MKAATANEIKTGLKKLSAAQLIEVCLRLARAKKETKELLTYLLFEADDRQAYIENVKKTIDENFADINASHLYYAKKSLRKILRSTNKYIRFAASKETEVELLLHFCQRLKESDIPLRKSSALTNLFEAQVKKVKAAVDSLHEDLQRDYLRQLEQLTAEAPKRKWW